MLCALPGFPMDSEDCAEYARTALSEYLELGLVRYHFNNSLDIFELHPIYVGRKTSCLHLGPIQLAYMLVPPIGPHLGPSQLAYIVGPSPLWAPANWLTLWAPANWLTLWAQPWFQPDDATDVLYMDSIGNQSGER